MPNGGGRTDGADGRDRGVCELVKDLA